MTVNLDTGVHTGDAQGDTYTNIEIIRGSAHADTLTGDAGDNILEGGAGDDTLTGNAGDDTLTGGEGGDNLFGGLGSDTADYSGASGGVTVSMARPKDLNKGEAQGDTYDGIENITGSAHSDTLYGNNSANALKGGSSKGHSVWLWR